MALFAAQAKEVDIIVTTALIPGKRAPKLILKEHVEAMKPGSVVVDLAAEAGGNCELTVPGQKIVHSNGVTIIGYTDLPSRLPTQASTLYSNNITRFLTELTPTMTATPEFAVNLDNEVVRRSIITYKGEKLWPAPAPAGAAPVQTATKPAETVAAPAPVALTPYQESLRTVALNTGALSGVLALGKYTTPGFMNLFTTLALAGLVGFRAVWNVVPALHSPLMSVTNALSGLVGVGGLFVMGGGFYPETFAQWLGAGSVFLANLNIFGGFLLTHRMLDLFRRPTDPPEYTYLYILPAIVFAGLLWYFSQGDSVSEEGRGGLVQAGYSASILLCIAALTGLSSQATARVGNAVGILGVFAGVVSTLVALNFKPEVIAQFGMVTAAGGGLGLLIGRAVTPMALPQTVAALHSVVGLAAVMTSAASVLGHGEHGSGFGDAGQVTATKISNVYDDVKDKARAALGLSPSSGAVSDGVGGVAAEKKTLGGLHLTTAYLGVLIGGVTFTGKSSFLWKPRAGLQSQDPSWPSSSLQEGCRPAPSSYPADISSTRPSSLPTWAPSAISWRMLRTP